MTRLGATSAVLFAVVVFTSCADPASDKSKAVTSEAVPVSSASPVVAAQKYLITPENSKIEFVGSKVTGSHNGSFEKFSGSIDYSGQIETSKVTITIDAASVKTDADGLTKHLQTPDFFDVAKFPQATFESTEIKAGGDKGASHTVTGNLNLHGVTKSITFPATIAAEPGAITVNSTFAINRKDFGINYAGGADNLIRDEVVMTLKVRGVK
ncbi:MAG TPA: YceI family protein [Pyrinomonadaceae bacterium]|nr:YceI family protein [Pyrinomonadaceae bacterium]